MDSRESNRSVAPVVRVAMVKVYMNTRQNMWLAQGNWFNGLPSNKTSSDICYCC